MNDIWEADSMPSIWKLANVIPIPKPDKDHSEPSKTIKLRKTGPKIHGNLYESHKKRMQQH
jgi:hypothetical protein